MSIVSTLALMASAVIARIRPPSLDDELAALQARLDDLNRRYDEHLANVTRQRDEWQGLAERFRDYALKQPTQQQIALAQISELIACNCVPGRHQLFTRDN